MLHIVNSENFTVYILQPTVYSSPFHKRTLCGNVVGSIAFSDHKTIRNNFCKIIFPQKLGEVFKLDPPIFTTPTITPKIKSVKTMPIWVFRQAQRSGKLPEAWF